MEACFEENDFISLNGLAERVDIRVVKLFPFLLFYLLGLLTCHEGVYCFFCFLVLSIVHALQE